MLASELASETIILGDDDQSIYGFKDADPDGIIALFNNQEVVKIPHDNICYRCPDTIVDYCTELLKKNKKRINKEWKKSEKVGGIYFKQLLTPDQCNDFMLSTIMEIKEKDKDASILVLSPLAVAVTTLKESMKAKGIDFVDCWSQDWDTEMLAKIWWMNVIFSKNKLPFVIFLLKHYGHFGKKKLLDLFIKSFHEGFAEADLIKKILEAGYLPDPFAAYITAVPTIKDFFRAHPDFSPLQEHINDDDVLESIIRLTSKVKKRKEFEKGKVNFMSIHKSKGLQAEYVIINGLVSGILPNETRGLDTIEAQRRLLFVGMTRATKELHMVSTVEWEGRDLRSNNADMQQFKFNIWKRKYYGKASKFVEEIKR
jgi:superfamily I DNA/RNA helicase